MIEPYRDGTFRWRVPFATEHRLVYARDPATAVRTAEHAQRLTNAPKGSRRATGPAVLLDPRTNRPAHKENANGSQA